MVELTADYFTTSGDVGIDEWTTLLYFAFFLSFLFFLLHITCISLSIFPKIYHGY